MRSNGEPTRCCFPVREKLPSTSDSIGSQQRTTSSERVFSIFSFRFLSFNTELNPFNRSSQWHLLGLNNAFYCTNQVNTNPLAWTDSSLLFAITTRLESKSCGDSFKGIPRPAVID